MSDQFQDVELDNLMNEICTSYTESAGAKEAMLRSAYTVARECLANYGCDSRNFVPAEEIMDLMGMPMDELMEDGIRFLILVEEKPGEIEKSVMINIYVDQWTQEAKIEGFLMQTDMRTGKEAIFIGNRWTPHFSFELNGEVVDCDYCDKKGHCDRYREQLLYESSDGRGSDAPGFSDVLYTAKQREILNRKGADAALLEAYTGSLGQISDEDFAALTESHRLLLRLFEEAGGLVDFVVTDVRQVYLFPDDLKHFGFAIEEKDGKYQLMQLIDTDMLLEALDVEFPQNAKEVFHRHVTAQTDDLQAVLAFLNEHVDRYARGGLPIYTIPLSLHASLKFSGPIGRRFILTKLMAEEQMEKLEEGEKAEGKQWLEDFGSYLRTFGTSRSRNRFRHSGPEEKE